MVDGINLTVLMHGSDLTVLGMALSAYLTATRSHTTTRLTKLVFGGQQVVLCTSLSNTPVRTTNYATLRVHKKTEYGCTESKLSDESTLHRPPHSTLHDPNLNPIVDLTLLVATGIDELLPSWIVVVVV